jgi:glycosyltransferase involved in cell wall biosynthesis
MQIGIDTLYESPAFPTGATGYMINLVRCLAQLDRENEYFLFVSEANRHLYAIEQENFHAVVCWASNEQRGRRIATQQFQVPGLVRKYGIEVFNSPGNTAPLLLGCHSVLTIKTMHHYRFADSLGWARTAFRRSMVYCSAKLADRIIANSTSNQIDIINYLGVPPEKVAVVPEAVDKSLFQKQISEEELEAKLKGYGVRRPFVLNVSSMWRYKNQTLLIRAFARLKKELRLPHQLVLVGASDQPDYLAEVHFTIQQSGIAEDVILLGYLPHSELVYFYRGTELFVYPSLFETFGLTLVEAMASGAPIVCSDRGSLPEVLGGAGKTVNPDDCEELADAMRQVLEDSELRGGLIQKGYARVQDFSWEKTSQQTRKLFLEAAWN